VSKQHNILMHTGLAAMDLNSGWKNLTNVQLQKRSNQQIYHIPIPTTLTLQLSTLNGIKKMKNLFQGHINTMSVLHTQLAPDLDTFVQLISHGSPISNLIIYNYLLQLQQKDTKVSFSDTFSFHDLKKYWLAICPRKIFH
jgi:hypothetical protein